MSDFTDAFGELLDAQQEGDGTRAKATVTDPDGNVLANNKDVITGSSAFQQLFVTGGQSDAGTFEIQMYASDFSAQPPSMSTVQVLGRSLNLIAPIDVSHGIYRMTIGTEAGQQP